MAPVPAPDEDECAELVPPALSLRPDDIKEYCVLFYLLLHYPAVLGCWVLAGAGRGWRLLLFRMLNYQRCSFYEG